MHNKLYIRNESISLKLNLTIIIVIIIVETTYCK